MKRHQPALLLLSTLALVASAAFGVAQQPAARPATDISHLYNETPEARAVPGVQRPYPAQNPAQIPAGGPVGYGQNTYAAPATPAPPMRPAGPFSRGTPPDAQLPAPGVEIYRFDSATIVAKVGPHVILAGDVLHGIPEDKIPLVSRDLIKKRLQQLIEQKMLYIVAEREVPADRMPDLRSRVADDFQARRVPQLMEELKASSVTELNHKLKAAGSSIAQQRELHIERTIAQQWMQQSLSVDEDVSHEELLDWYNEHKQDYEVPAKARFRVLTVRFGEGRMTEAQAYQKLAWMGNQVAVGGVDFGAMARQHSDDRRAEQGGEHDWTGQGSLRSVALDRALFSQPVGSMGPILRDDSELHIVQVLQRRPAGHIPFTEVQAEIRKKIRKRRFRAAHEEYFAEVKESIRVQSIFDDDEASDRFLASLRGAVRR